MNGIYYDTMALKDSIIILNNTMKRLKDSIRTLNDSITGLNTVLKSTKGGSNSSIIFFIILLIIILIILWKFRYKFIGTPTIEKPPKGPNAPNDDAAIQNIYYEKIKNYYKSYMKKWYKYSILRNYSYEFGITLETRKLLSEQLGNMEHSPKRRGSLYDFSIPSSDRKFAQKALNEIVSKEFDLEESNLKVTDCIATLNDYYKIKAQIKALKDLHQYIDSSSEGEFQKEMRKLERDKEAMRETIESY